MAWISILGIVIWLVFAVLCNLTIVFSMAFAAPVIADWSAWWMAVPIVYSLTVSFSLFAGD